VLIGVTIISVTVGPGGVVDQSGELGEIAAAPGGRLLLWVLVIALFALVLWRLVDAVLARGTDRNGRWTHWIGDLATAVIYVLLGITALVFARGSSRSTFASSQPRSARILSMHGGVALLIAIGLGISSVGVAAIVHGVARRFLKRIAVPPGTPGKVLRTRGAVGYRAEGGELILVGSLFWLAAVTLDPTRASGLDGALRANEGMPFGELMLVLAGIGFISSGPYSEFRARYARL
jgi:uncharacterized membrane protein